MKVPESVIAYIIKEIGNLRYGRVIIEVVETSNKIDVLTESRERFNVKGEIKNNECSKNL